MTRPQKSPDSIWRLTLLASVVAGLLALRALLSVPSQSDSAVWLGFSPERLVLAAALLLPNLALGWAALRWRHWAPRLQPRLSGWLRSVSPAILLGSLALGALLAAGISLLSPERAISVFGPNTLYIQRLQPIFGYLAWLCVAGCVLWAAARGLSVNSLRQAAGLRSSLLVFLGLLGVVAIILISRLGLGYDATQWSAPNAPVLITQVVMAVAAAAALWAVGRWLVRRGGLPLPRLDFALAALVWLAAASLWLAQPAQPTYYSAPPLPPNYESYPLSDAFNHDIVAQNVLVGEGFRFGGIVATRRPLYVLFLAVVQALFTADYSKVITLQVLLLAGLPAGLYLLGARMHHRFSGLLAAGLIIFRETNAIALGHIINLSHAKLLMADLPAALGIVLVGVLATRWLTKPRPDTLGALVTGGVLGAFILLRSQMLTVVPVFILLAVLVWGLRKGWRAALLFGLGVLLVASPWVLRNRLGMGQWAIEDSIVSGFLANRYRYEPGTFGLPFLEGESEGEYYARQMGAVRSFTAQDPLYVAGFVADNFVRNQIINFMTLPTSPVLRSLDAHVRVLPYWPSWDGALAPESWAIVALNLALVSVGVVASWRRLRWVGLVPLFINLGFTANLALARVAGWRYNLPADWTVLLYYAIGIGQLGVWLAAALGANQAQAQWAAPKPARPAAKSARPTPSAAGWVATVAILLIAGSSFSIIEALSVPRYSKLGVQDALAVLQSMPAAPAGLTDQLAAGQLDILHGRALYPAYYAAGQGDERGFLLNQVQDYSRVSFYLIGPQPGELLLPLVAPPESFPHGADALVLRCNSLSLDVLAVILPQYGTILPSSRFDEACHERP